MLFSVYDRTGKRRMFYTTVESCIPSRDTINALLKSGYIVKKTGDGDDALPTCENSTAPSTQTPISDSSASQQNATQATPLIPNPDPAGVSYGSVSTANVSESEALHRNRGRKPGKKSLARNESEDYTQLSM